MPARRGERFTRLNLDGARPHPRTSGSPDGRAPPSGPYAASYACREPHTLAFGHAHRRPVSATFTITVSDGTLYPTTRPSPSGEVTLLPTFGAVALNSWYSGCSYFRQHM